MSATWDETFLKITKLYADEFYKSDVEEYLRLLTNSPIRMSILCITYDILCKQGKMLPLNKIDRTEMEELFNEAKRLSEDHSAENLRKICRSIHTLGTFIQL